MKNALKVIKELKAKGLIDEYAIGGGIAALFYIETFLTYDLDIFIILSEKRKNGGMVSLSPIFDYLGKKGYSFKGEHVAIEGIPVQFITAGDLEEEAVLNAKVLRFQSIQTRVLAPEYLIAVLLSVGRNKDIIKIRKLLDLEIVDRGKLNRILKKYHLIEKFNSLRKRP